MSAILSAELSLDASKFIKDVELARQKNEAMRQSIEEANKELHDWGVTANTTKGQFRQLTKLVVDQQAQWEKLSDDIKNSDFGQQMAMQIQAMKEKAGELKDTIGDINQEISYFASDTAKLDAITSAVGGGISAFQGLQGVIGLCGGQSKRLEEAMQKVIAAQGVLNALTSISNTLNKSSASYQAIRAFQTKLLTKAIMAESTATGVATIKQRIFNAVAKANPYVLLASAILGVVGALYALCDGEDESIEKADKAQKTTDKLKSSVDHLNDSMYSQLAKLDILAKQWGKLQTVQQKTKFIEDYKKTFEELGLAINNVADAESAFGNNLGQLRQAIIKKIEYQITYQKALDATTKIMKLQHDLEEGLLNNWDADTIKEIDTELKQLKAEREELINTLAEGAPTSSKSTTKKTTSTKNKEKGVIAQTLPWLEKQLSTEKERLNTLKLGTDEYKKQLGVIAELEQRVKLAKNGSTNWNSKINLDIDKEKIGGQLVLDVKAPDSKKILSSITAVTQAVQEANAKVNESFQQTWESYPSTIESLSNAFDDLGKIIGGVGGELLSWASKSTLAIADMLRENAKLLISYQATSMGGAAKSAFALPFPYNLAVWATLASTVMGIFSSLPKFESGGIVGGNSYHGDKLLARLNSGEMVLSKRQQATLYRQLNGKDGITNVKFVIRGQDLVGIINNYNKKLSRI